MTVWQISMALSLSISTVACLVVWHLQRRKYMPHYAVLGRWQRWFMRYGYVLALQPVTDALVLWKAGFFG